MLRGAAVRSIASTAVAVTLLHAGGTLAGGTLVAGTAWASAHAAAPKGVKCSTVSGSLLSATQDVDVSGCTPSSEVGSAGTGSFPAQSVVASGSGTDTVTFNNGATATFTYTNTDFPFRSRGQCGDGTKISMSGTVVSNGSLPSGDPGVATTPKRVKGLLCLSGGGFQFHLIRGVMHF